MAANVYDCMFILDTTKVAGDIATAEKQIRTVLEKHGAEVLVSRPWDERRLAYPIRNQKKGLYYMVYFSSEGRNVVEMERDFAITEMIMRHIIIKIDPKMVETMLTLARGEHATALHNYTEEPGELGSGGGGHREGGHGGGDGEMAGAGGRRGRRE
jgi:small subunit ribosomal protein S6